MIKEYDKGTCPTPLEGLTTTDKAVILVATQVTYKILLYLEKISSWSVFHGLLFQFSN